MTLERATTPRVDKHIAIVDVATNAPVAAARLRLVYNFDWLDDWEENAVTNGRGVADVKCATEYAHLLYADVEANGYRRQSRISLSGLESLDTVTILLGKQAPGPAR